VITNKFPGLNEKQFFPRLWLLARLEGSPVESIGSRICRQQNLNLGIFFQILSKSKSHAPKSNLFYVLPFGRCQFFGGQKAAPSQLKLNKQQGKQMRNYSPKLHVSLKQHL